jgi:pseudouridine-5'-phosphate glycosidase
MFAASRSDIRVFATGGIGGVHRGSPFDISADLHELAETPMIVVCAGAKAILDLPATLEYLETMGVTVIGYKTEEFPSFYSRESGLKVSLQLDTPQAIAEFWGIQKSVGIFNAVLVANPIPKADAIPRIEMEPIIERAVKEAQDRKIHGQGLTPFLLQRISELTNKRSIRANLSLLLNNARLAAQIALSIATNKNRKEVR